MRTWTLTREQTDALRYFLENSPDVHLSGLQSLLPLLDAEKPYVFTNKPCPEFERDYTRFIKGFGFSGKFAAHAGDDLEKCEVCRKAVEDAGARTLRAFEELGKMIDRERRLAGVRHLADKIFKPNIIPSRTRARAREPQGRKLWGLWPIS